MPALTERDIIYEYIGRVHNHLYMRQWLKREEQARFEAVSLVSERFWSFN